MYVPAEHPKPQLFPCLYRLPQPGGACPHSAGSCPAGAELLRGCPRLPARTAWFPLPSPSRSCALCRDPLVASAGLSQFLTLLLNWGPSSQHATPGMTSPEQRTVTPQSAGQAGACKEMASSLIYLSQDQAIFIFS